jgi:hypothetical protein
MTNYTKPSFDELVFAFDEIAKYRDEQILADNNDLVRLPSCYIISGFDVNNEYVIKEKKRNIEQDLPEDIHEHFATVNNNVLALKDVKAKDYNKANFDSVISSLERDGKEHFRMSVFFANITRKSYEHDSFELTPVSGENDFSAIFNNATSEFNCNSVACIAGFAIAEASDWRIKSLYKNIDLAENYVVLNLAANYLNIPLSVAESIFYANEHTVWSWLKAQQYYDFRHGELTKQSEQVDSRLNKFKDIESYLDKFGDVDFDQDYFYSCEEYGYEQDTFWENCGIDMVTITWKEAVALMTLIRDEIIVLDRKFPGKLLGSVPSWNSEKISELQASK